jgi:MFS superfamily sulfate permease-like transporter
LAAVVLVAVSGLIDVPALQRIYRFSKEDFLVAALAMVGVLASGLLRGVLLASVFSLVLLIRRASRPYVAVLGRAPGSGWFGDLARDPQNEEIPRTLIVRVSGAIVYFNAEVIGDQIAALARQRGADLRLVVIALGMVPMVDLAGSDMLTRLHADLAAHGVGVDLAEAHGQVRDALAAAGAAEKFPGLGAGRGIAEAIAEHEGELAKVR